MTLNRSRRSWISGLLKNQKKQRRCRDEQRAQRRLRSEMLETRRVLATLVWDGGGADANWSTDENWSTDVAPVAGDALVFPTTAASKTAVNDFPAGTTFGSMLFQGDGYSLTGQPIVLDGSLTNAGAHNSVGLSMQLANTAGFANTAAATFTVTGTIDLGSFDLSISNTSSQGVVELQNSISGTGGLRVSGSGSGVLAAANSYGGETVVQGATLVVQNATGLGAADGTAATGTRVESGGRLRLENSITVANELLSTSTAYLQSNGDNVWTGDINSTGSTYLYVWPDSNSSLQIDGDVTTYRLDARYGATILNGASNSIRFLYLYNGELDINGTVEDVWSGVYITSQGTLTVDGTLRVFQNFRVVSGGVVTGTGVIELLASGQQLDVAAGGTLAPGTTSGPGILSTGNLLLDDGSHFDVQLAGTTPGAGHDQVQVTGTVTLGGSLNIDIEGNLSVGDSFLIIENDGSEAVIGSFENLIEGSLLAVGDDYFRISYRGGDGNDVVLTAVAVDVWDGGGGDNLWSNPQNWTANAVPAAGANVVFPVSTLAATTIQNDLPAGTAFGSLLIEGSNYTLNGNPMSLDGAIVSGGSGNTLAAPLTLASASGLASTTPDELTVAGAIDLNGNELSISAARAGVVALEGVISGTGGLSFSGGGTAILDAANSYDGPTLVSGGTLVVPHALSLGSADGSAATGTQVVNDATIRLENSITVANELLTFEQLRLESVGDNRWTGDLADNQNGLLGYLDLRPDQAGSLRLDGNVTTRTLDARTGNVILNGAANVARSNVRVWNHLQLNGDLETGYVYTYSPSQLEVQGTLKAYGSVYAYSGSTVTGTGVINDPLRTSDTMRVRGGTLDPGTTTGPGILEVGNLLVELDYSNLNVQLQGTMPGSGYDQVQVVGSVRLDGRLNIDVDYPLAIGDSFRIIDNDGTDPVNGAFDELGEGGLFQVGSDYFRISYRGGDGNDVVLTAVAVGVWDGGGADARWSTPENWVGDVLPQAGANLIFPAGAPRTQIENDLAADTTFGAILLEGDGYDLSGNRILLSGSIASDGVSNRLALPLKLATSAGIASNAATTFDIAAPIDLNGNDLTINTARNGTVVLANPISGSGDVRFSGGGTGILAAANSYQGATLVDSSTLVVRHASSLGAADNTQATGTQLLSGALLRLENSITIANERLSSEGGGIISVGDNRWTGDIVHTGPYQYSSFNGSTGSSLQLDGNVNLPYVQYYSHVILTGTSNSASTISVTGGHLELQGNLTVTGAVYVYGPSLLDVRGTLVNYGDTRVYSNGVLTGTGAIQNPNRTSDELRVAAYGTLDPGTTSAPGVLTTDDLVIEDDLADFDVQLAGLDPGTGYDQLRVTGTVQLAGSLNVTLQSSFASENDEFVIIDNDGTDPVTGNFQGLPENGLVEYGGNFWSISYQGGDGNDVVLTTDTVNRFPVGDPQEVRTLEDTSVGVTLTGSDPEGDPITFSIETQPAHGTLSGTAPNLTYTPDLNYAGTDSFEFRVTDGFGGFTTQTVSIVIDPVQDPPTGVSVSPGSIEENSPSGTSVGTLSATDPDLGDTFTYTLVSGSGAADNGLFAISGDNLLLNAVADFEAKSSYSVRVRTTDAAGASAESALNIAVINRYEAPTGLTLSATSLSENVPVDTIVGTFTTTDPDAVDSHRYFLVSGAGSSDNSAFRIVGNQLRITEVPDFESQSRYHVRVRTVDQGGLSTEAAFTIDVSNVNEAPFVSTPLADVSVEEDAADTVINVSAVFTDVDVASSGDTLTLAVSGNNAALVTPLLTNQTLVLDYAQNQSGTAVITLTATDAAGLSATESFTVSVTAVADPPLLHVPGGVSADSGSPVPLPVSAELTDDSETLEVLICGVPEGATLSSGTDNGDGSWTVPAEDLATLEVITPEHFEGEFDLIVKATSTIGDGSSASTERTVTASVNAVAAEPTLRVGSFSVQEDHVVAMPIRAELVDTDGSETLTVTVSGLPAGATLSDGTNVSGSPTTDVTDWDRLAITVLPPANSDVDFGLTVTATSTEQSNGDTAVTEGIIPVTVHAVADAPNLTVAAASGSEAAAIPLAISASLTDTDQSEVLSLQIAGVPAGAELSAGTNQGSGVWSLTPAQLPNLTITVPDDASLNLTVTARSRELANNSIADTTAGLAVTVANVAPDFEAGGDELLLPPVVGVFQRTIAFTDPGPLDTHEVTVNFGDGTGAQSFSVGPAGTRSFTLNHTFTADGIYQVTVTLEDDDEDTHTDTFEVEVLLNTPPEADAGGPYTAKEATSLTLDASASTDAQNNITGYAWDLDGDGAFDDATGVAPQLSASQLRTLGLGDDGRYPIAVEVTDAFGATDIAPSTIVIENVAPTADDDAATVSEDGPAVTIAVLDGDTDPAGDLDPLVVTGVDATGVLGSVSFTASSVVYSPAGAFEHLAVGETATETFTYSITDGDEGTAVGTVRVTVTGVNDAPVATGESYSVAEDDTLAVASDAGVLANDTDIDTSDVLQVSAVNGVASQVGVPVALAHGTLTLRADGSFLYEPSGFCDVAGQTETFAYTVSDGNGGTDVATATIAINPAVAAGVTTFEAGILRIGGTAADDTIILDDVGGILFQNGQDMGISVSNITEIRVWGRAGNDRIDLGSLSVDSYLIGGDGDDDITGGSARDLIFGGAGADHLNGAAGDDLLAGGDGADRLVGAAGDDILLAGKLACGTPRGGIQRLLDQWSDRNVSADEEAAVDALYSDDDLDQLTGAAGADWFIVGEGDAITDLPAGDRHGDWVSRL